MDVGAMKKEIPVEIKYILERENVKQEDVILSVESDLDLNGFFCASYLLVTKDSLIVVNGKMNQDKWNEKETKFYKLSDIEKFKTEQDVSSGILVAVIDNKDYLVCRYTNTCNREFGIFTKLFNKFKENNQLEEEDFKKDEMDLYCPKCGMRYEDPVRKLCPKCFDKRKIFLRVLAYLPKYKVSLFFILLCMLISSGLNVLIPYLTGNIFYDHILKDDAYELFIKMDLFGKVGLFVLTFFVIKLFATCVSVIYGRINSSMSAKVVFDLKTEIFTALQKLSLKFYGNRQTGTLMNHVNGDAMNLQYFFHDGAPYFIVNVITMIGIFSVMLSMNWLLALIVLIPIPLIVFVLKRIFPKQWLYYSRMFRRNSKLNSIISDSLQGSRVVKAFGKEQAEVDRFGNANEEVYQVNVAVGNMTQTVYPFLYFFMGTSTLIIWGYGGYLVASKQLSFGSLITFTGYVGMLMGPLQFMTQITNWWSNCMNSASRIFEILDTVPEVIEKRDAVSCPQIKGAIDLNHVTFEYEPNKPVLKDIDFHIKPGEMIGIVGKSGAGKSTLINLITRLYDIKEGSILIDGVNVKDMVIHDLHSQVGLVLQETYLFMGSIADNIAYGKTDATMEEIIMAAKIANCHDFIMKLPDGYDTVIGQGKSLSGGEKQRISIARAVLIDPKILILDEATASLDVETERQIQEALERLIKGRTTIAIAHRLSTLRNADRLMVIEHGEIKETGTYEELVALKGIYYKLLEKQNEALQLQGV